MAGAVLTAGDPRRPSLRLSTSDNHKACDRISRACTLWRDGGH